MLIGYIWKLRALRLSFSAYRIRRGWIQIGRLCVDTSGGRGIVFVWHGRKRRLI
jgi:hypothetical protein